MPLTVTLAGAIAHRGADVLRHRLSPSARIVALADDATAEERAACLEESQVLVTVRLSADDGPLSQLRLLHLPVSGLDAIDFGAVPPECPVCNVYEHGVGVSEYVLAAMLEWTVGLAARSARFKAGSWAESPRLSGPLRPELAGRTLALVGYGTIARAVAERAGAFGMRVLAVTRNPESRAGDPVCAGSYARLTEILNQADFVVLALPLDEGTRGLIGREALAAMKPSAVLINVARGPIVDEDALFEALSAGRLGGAVLDTWYSYPAPGRESVRPSRLPFETLDNVLMTPHLGSWSEGLIERRFAVIADNIERLRKGEPLVNLVPRP